MSISCDYFYFVNSAFESCRDKWNIIIIIIKTKTKEKTKK